MYSGRAKRARRRRLPFASDSAAFGVVVLHFAILQICSFPFFTLPPPALSLRLQAFPCRLVPSSPEPRALDHAAIRWMPLQEVESLSLAGADHRLWDLVRAIVEKTSHLPGPS